MKQSHLLSFSLPFLTFGLSLQADSPGQTRAQECLSPYHRMHISARHNENKGVGYKDGYTTLEAFGIYDSWSHHFMPFLDLRGHVFNNGKLAGNVGIGERTLFSSINHTFGSYLYYDVRRIGHGLTVNQLSPGLELVGKRMEYRINGYFPVGKDKTYQYGYKYEFDEFAGNRIFLKSRSKQQRAMRGGDAELGVHITQSTKYDLYAAAGPYYFQAPHASSWGGRTRLLGRYKEYVSLEVAYSYDHLFRSIVQGSVAVTLPFGRKLKRTGEGCPQGNDLLLSRAAFAPSRFEIPVVKRVTRRGRERAINPATGLPWTVWFVNNTSSSAGTFESPFPTLVQAQNASSPNDMIYVFPGDGTTKGMNQGITLKDGQPFLSSGIAHKIHTKTGKITIPKFSNTSPSITNTGNVVTVANGNEVSGFHIIAGLAGAAGVFNTSTINGANINHNVFTGAVQHTGISITGFGKILIKNNQLTGFSSGGQCIRLTVADGLTMTGETSNNLSSGYFFGIGMNVGSNSTADYQISYNTVTGSNLNAIFWGTSANGNAKFQGSIIGNQLSAIGTQVMLIQSGNNNTLVGDLNVQGNTIFNYPQTGLRIDIKGNGDFSCNLQDNTIAKSNGVGFFGVNATTSNGSPTLNLGLINNTNAGNYSLVNSSGTFNLGPVIGNTGQLNATNVTLVD